MFRIIIKILFKYYLEKITFCYFTTLILYKINKIECHAIPYQIERKHGRKVYKNNYK